MADVKLDWAQATVEDGKLTIPLEGEQPSGWKESFENTIRLLGGGEWGEVKKGTVRVAAATPGEEDTLRHYLESLVEQANSADREQESERDGDSTPAPEGVDAEMTERFRSFAEQESEPEHASD
jgi:hypothetical protein